MYQIILGSSCVDTNMKLWAKENELQFSGCVKTMIYSNLSQGKNCQT